MEPAVVIVESQRRLDCAAGARGRGGARSPAAPRGRPTRPGMRLPSVAWPLREVPGAACCAAAGPVRRGDGAESGGGEFTPGAGRLVHEGALQMAAAVPRLQDGTVEGWDGKAGRAKCQPKSETKYIQVI